MDSRESYIKGFREGFTEGYLEALREVLSKSSINEVIKIGFSREEIEAAINNDASLLPESFYDTIDDIASKFCE